MHCCIVNFVPPVRAVLPLCGLFLEKWSSNPKSAEKPTVGRSNEKYESTPAGGISQTLVWGKQSVWLSACRTPTPKGENRAEAQTHLLL